LSGTPPAGYVAAVEYLQRGWSVIPVNPRTKAPLLAWEEYQARPPTIAELRTWWQKWQHAGVGVITGRVSGLVRVHVLAVRSRGFGLRALRLGLLGVRQLGHVAALDVRRLALVIALSPRLTGW